MAKSRLTGLQISKAASKVAADLNISREVVMAKITTTGWYKVYRTRRSEAALPNSIKELMTSKVTPKVSAKYQTQSFYSSAEQKVLNNIYSTKKQTYSYTADNNKSLGMFKRAKNIIDHGTREQKETFLKDIVAEKIDYNIDKYEEALDEEIARLDSMSDREIADLVLDIEFNNKYMLNVGEVYGS